MLMDVHLQIYQQIFLFEEKEKVSFSDYDIQAKEKFYAATCLCFIHFLKVKRTVFELALLRLLYM